MLSSLSNIRNPRFRRPEIRGMLFFPLPQLLRKWQFLSYIGEFRKISGKERFSFVYQGIPFSLFTKLVWNTRGLEDLFWMNKNYRLSKLQIITIITKQNKIHHFSFKKYLRHTLYEEMALEEHSNIYLLPWKIHMRLCFIVIRDQKSWQPIQQGFDLH